MSFLNNFSDETDNPVTQSRKRQEAGPSYLSQVYHRPLCSHLHLPVLPKQDVFHIKNNRPYITAGSRHSTIVEAWAAQGFNKVTASDFLEDLQQRQTFCSDPAQGASPVRFLIMVVKSKAYAACKPVFEAQDQAAVSGSCMTKLQHELADLAKAPLVDLR